MKIASLICSLSTLISNFTPTNVVQIFARVGIFFVFWKSVQTKISGGTIFGQHLQFWNLSDTTFFIFEEEYALPILPYDIAAYLATFGEFFLSIGILLGLLTQISALGLFIMTLVIQIFVYPEAWSVHILWAGLLLILMKDGAGSLSLDALLKRRCTA